MRTGAAASINKESAAEELAIAIRKILSGVLYASASLAEILIANLDDDAGKPLHENLLDREHEIMKLISSGVPLTEIADKLHVSVKTIRSYRSRIMKKCR